jgi:hypothetical protein
MLAIRGLGIFMVFPSPTNNCISRSNISNELLNTPNKDCMQKLHPRKVDTSTNHLETHRPFVASPPKVKVLEIKGYLFILKGHSCGPLYYLFVNEHI